MWFSNCLKFDYRTLKYFWASKYCKSTNFIKFGFSENKVIWRLLNLASPRGPVSAVYDQRICWRRQILAKTHNSPNIMARQNLLIYSSTFFTFQLPTSNLHHCNVTCYTFHYKVQTALLSGSPRDCILHDILTDQNIRDAWRNECVNPYTPIQSHEKDLNNRLQSPG